MSPIKEETAETEEVLATSPIVPPSMRSKEEFKRQCEKEQKCLCKSQQSWILPVAERQNICIHVHDHLQDFGDGLYNDLVEPLLQTLQAATVGDGKVKDSTTRGHGSQEEIEQADRLAPSSSKIEELKEKWATLVEDRNDVIEWIRLECLAHGKFDRNETGEALDFNEDDQTEKIHMRSIDDLKEVCEWTVDEKEGRVGMDEGKMLERGNRRALED